MCSIPLPVRWPPSQPPCPRSKQKPPHRWPRQPWKRQPQTRRPRPHNCEPPTATTTTKITTLSISQLQGPLQWSLWPPPQLPLLQWLPLQPSTTINTRVTVIKTPMENWPLPQRHNDHHHNDNHQNDHHQNNHSTTAPTMTTNTTTTIIMNKPPWPMIIITRSPPEGLPLPWGQLFKWTLVILIR